MVFIDTRAFLARYVARGEHYIQAQPVWGRLISFALIKRFPIRTAFTFDHDFVRAGFEVIGRR